MSIIARRPGRWASITFPPVAPAPRATYRYVTGGAWTKGKREGFRDIATAHGFSDPWDLIFYNFQVRNPAEVNWCLNHFLGCTKSVDGKNHCLDRSDRNPVLHIPPAGFRAFSPAAERVRARIIETLEQSETSMIQFDIGPLKVDLAMFQKVVAALRSGSILALAIEPGQMPGIRAMYGSELDFFFLRDPDSFDTGKRALVVHESVHAGMDITRQGGKVLLHEAAAHVAEAMRVALALPDPRLVNIAAIPSRHGRAAMHVANRFITHSMTHTTRPGIDILDPLYLELRNALDAVPEYHARAGGEIGSNGI